MTRELSDRQRAEQAAALRDHVERGGDAHRWLDSKDFAPEDRAAIVLGGLSEADAPNAQKAGGGMMDKPGDDLAQARRDAESYGAAFEAADQTIAELEASLSDAHCLLQDAFSAVDPEAHPDLSERLAQALECGLPQCAHVSELARQRDDLIRYATNVVAAIDRWNASVGAIIDRDPGYLRQAIRETT